MSAISKSLIIRFGYLIGLLGAVLWLPAWIAVALGLGAIIHQSKFYDILLPAFIFDVHYGVAGATWFGFQYLATALALALVYLIEALKNQLR